MKRQKEIILIVVSFFILSVMWIGFTLYHNAVTSTISAPLNEDIKDINPDFKSNIIQTLKNRAYVAPLYSMPSNPVQTASSGAQPIQIHSVTASTSGQIQSTTP
jgi:hypothetical protein